MRVKTSELQGAALDWAVAKCAYDNPVIVENGIPYLTSMEGHRIKRACPSSDWAQGGPIIERARLKLRCDERTDRTLWVAATAYSTFAASGPTPLVAAMRCYAAFKLGDEIEVSSELL
jgi:hypothetical protein